MSSRSRHAKRGRTDSDLQTMQADTNKNVEWIRSRWFWVAYIILLVIVRLVLMIALTQTADDMKLGWTILNILHAAISFVALHWMRGSPIWEDQGEYIDMTVWEQIDNGVPWTITRKFLLIVPIALFLMSAHAILGDTLHLSINVGVVFILIVAKLPELHGFRLFGINKSSSDD